MPCPQLTPPPPSSLLQLTFPTRHPPIRGLPPPPNASCLTTSRTCFTWSTCICNEGGGGPYIWHEKYFSREILVSKIQKTALKRTGITIREGWSAQLGKPSFWQKITPKEIAFHSILLLSWRDPKSPILESMVTESIRLWGYSILLPPMRENILTQPFFQCIVMWPWQQSQFTPLNQITH